jgi:hypothetical protein
MVKQSPGLIIPSSEFPSCQLYTRVGWGRTIMQDPWGLVEIPSYSMSCELFIYAKLVRLRKRPTYQNLETYDVKRLTV